MLCWKCGCWPLPTAEYRFMNPKSKVQICHWSCYNIYLTSIKIKYKSRRRRTRWRKWRCKMVRPGTRWARAHLCAVSFDSDKKGNDPIHAVVPLDASHVFIIRHQSYMEPASADSVCVKSTLTFFLLIEHIICILSVLLIVLKESLSLNQHSTYKVVLLRKNSTPRICENGK